MAVQRVEEYRMKNGVEILKVILKPTKVFPNGYFYADACLIDLVQESSWCLSKQGNRVMVIANNYGGVDCFHQELCNFYLGYYVDYIDHINHCEFDDIDQNLNVVTNQQNSLNKFTRGYQLNKNQSKLAFQPTIKLNGRVYHPFSQVYKEDEACIKQHLIEQDFARIKLQEDYYMFDFKKYRRGELDLLDLERTGVISEDEATYKHILKYKDNAWYYLRYDLEEYFKDNHIPVPRYTIDEQGFMVHPITNEKLCPFSVRGT